MLCLALLYAREQNHPRFLLHRQEYHLVDSENGTCSEKLAFTLEPRLFQRDTKLEGFFEQVIEVIVGGTSNSGQILQGSSVDKARLQYMCLYHRYRKCFRYVRPAEHSLCDTFLDLQ